jgi:hypothetical protein
VLVRGIHRGCNQVQWRRQTKVTDWTAAYASIVTRVLAPLADAHVFLATYQSDPDEEARLLAAYAPRAVHVEPLTDRSTQAGLFRAGLQLVLDAQRGGGEGGTAFLYDTVYVLRFDMELLMDVHELQLHALPDRINWLWREDNERAWAANRFIADTLHILPGRHVAALAAGIDDCPVMCDAHHIYPYVLAHLPAGEADAHIMFPGYITCDTDRVANAVFRLLRAFQPGPPPAPVHAASRARSAAAAHRRRL